MHAGALQTSVSGTQYFEISINRLLHPDCYKDVYVYLESDGSLRITCFDCSDEDSMGSDNLEQLWCQIKPPRSVVI